MINKLNIIDIVVFKSVYFENSGNYNINETAENTWRQTKISKIIPTYMS